MTVPPACPQCKGSGQLIEWLDPPEEICVKDWKMRSHIGFLQVPCGLCWGLGTLIREESPLADPKDWVHRVPIRKKLASA